MKSQLPLWITLLAISSKTSSSISLKYARNPRGPLVAAAPHYAFCGHSFFCITRVFTSAKRRGYRIELGEIENVLYRHEGIQQAAVVATPDTESGVKIIAYVVRRDESAVSIVDLKVFCSKTLPVYFIPDVFVFRDSLPRTSTDKVDYPSLLQEAPAVATR